MNPTAPAAAAPAPLRFTAGARERVDPIHYDEVRTLGASAVVFPEAKIPVGNWLQLVDMIITIASTGNSATVALQPDAPWSCLNEVAFIDAGGSTIDALSGYNMYLMNLLGGFTFQTDPAASPAYTALTTGGGGTAGSGSFILRLPVEIINRDAIGAYPNGASNAAVRVAVTAAPLASIYSTAPNGAVTMRVQMTSQGYVLPAVASPGGRAYADAPRGAGTFQQWSQIAYDLTVGRRVLQHTRKSNPYRTLILVARTAAGARSDAVVTSLEFRIDDIASERGPWSYLKHRTWQRHAFPASALPVGVVQVSFAHEWDGKVGGELRDAWVDTQPGTKVEVETDVAATGTLQIITNEIVTAVGDGVLRV